MTRRAPIGIALAVVTVIVLLAALIVVISGAVGQSPTATLTLPQSSKAVALYAPPVIDVPTGRGVKGVLVVGDANVALAMKVRIAGTPAVAATLRIAGQRIPFLPSPAGNGVEAVARIGPMPNGRIPFVITARSANATTDSIRLEEVRVAWAAHASAWLSGLIWMIVLGLPTLLILILSLLWTDTRAGRAEA